MNDEKRTNDLGLMLNLCLFDIDIRQASLSRSPSRYRKLSVQKVTIFSIF